MISMEIVEITLIVIVMIVVIVNCNPGRVLPPNIIVFY